MVDVWSHRWAVGAQGEVETERQGEFALKQLRQVEREGLITVGKCHLGGAWNRELVFKATRAFNGKPHGWSSVPLAP